MLLGATIQRNDRRPQRAGHRSHHGVRSPRRFAHTFRYVVRLFGCATLAALRDRFIDAHRSVDAEGLT